MKVPSDYRRLFKDLREEGVEITGGGSQHFQLRFPSGAVVYAAGSPSDRRNMEHLLAKVKRARAGRQGAP